VRFMRVNGDRFMTISMKVKNLSSLVVTTITLASTLTSCAGPENYQQKMARYTPKNSIKNQVPEIRISEFNFKTNQQPAISKLNRSPAQSPDAPFAKESTSELNTTNKKLYFLTLFSQFETLKNDSPNFIAPALDICPNFHAGLLKHNEGKSRLEVGQLLNNKFSYDSSKLNDELYIASYPELLLPLSKEESTPRVIDLLKNKDMPMNEFAINELVHKAIDIHLAKTYSEIRELCEYGVSDNYYIYENLITHIKNNPFNADNKNMNILLKTTLFSNIALITSLNKKTNPKKPGRSIASVDILGKKEKGQYANEIMTRLNVTWANQYFDFIKSSH